MSNKYFLFIFLGILGLDLLVIGTNLSEQLRYLTKPLITISLLIFLFYAKGISKRMQKFLVLGLIFSLLGDSLLLFSNKSQLYFISGLLGFLIAHIMYISAFYKKRHTKQYRTAIGIVFLALYAIIIFYYIYPRLGGLLPYVVIYMLVLLLMVLTTFLRKPLVPNKSYALVFSGALCFMVSDSILALDKFYTSIPLAGFAIMLTYGIAQLLLVFGGISENSPTKQL